MNACSFYWESDYSPYRHVMAAYGHSFPLKLISEHALLLCEVGTCLVQFALGTVRMEQTQCEQNPWIM